MNQIIEKPCKYWKLYMNCKLRTTTFMEPAKLDERFLNHN